MSKSALKTDLYGKKTRLTRHRFDGRSIQLIPTGDHKILDVGCGAGQTLKKLKELSKANEIVGIEIDEQVTRDLSDTLDRLYVGDVETMDLPYTEK